MPYFRRFNTYKNDMQNDLFVATDILGETNTQPSIPYIVFEKFVLTIYYFSKLKH